MRAVLIVLWLGLAAAAFAQSPGDRPLPTQPAPQKKPAPKAPALQPLPEPPPAPPGMESDQALEPQVTIQKRGNETIEEYSVNGRKYMVKVTPANGIPYYLIDDVGRGDFVRRDSFDTRTRPPMWVIHQW